MILFINFAPLSFGGGAERWLITVANELSKKEKVWVIQIHHSISNIYAKIVFNRKFEHRLDTQENTFDQMHITWSMFIPFSPSWKKIRILIKDARLIYFKFDLNELGILLFFGGLANLKKTIVGLHSPLLYAVKNISTLEKLHNIIYLSPIVKYFLNQVKKIHVLSEEQKEILVNKFDISNAVVIPNFIETVSTITFSASKRKLEIIFIGELDKRKGADILLEIIKKSPMHFSFTVIGDGYLKDEFILLKIPNLHYKGYLPQNQVKSILNTGDILLMPSHAEGFSLASLEALARGLVVVCSSMTNLSILKEYLVINQTDEAGGYVKVLKNLYIQKITGLLQARRKKIWRTINETFSQDIILNQLETKIFSS